MKLLVITQKVDIDDPILGFFHGWIKEFAKHFESIVVIALGVGRYDLPENVKVLSLGKELGVSKVKYLFNFYRYVWQERKNYDAVFVHMNQEYILLAGWWWRLWGKKVAMWRNHHAGSWLTDIAAWFCTKVFCTSKYSYTAKYKKTVLMPVGIDLDVFKAKLEVVRVGNSILFLGRMSPVKKPHILIEALGLLKSKGVNFTASFYGDALPKDQSYYQSLKQKVIELGLADRVVFYPGVTNQETAAIYSKHDLFVNLSSSGMYDKTIFEAMVCGALVVACNKNLSGLVDEGLLFVEDDPADLAAKVEFSLAISDNERARMIVSNHGLVVSQHSLYQLALKLKDIYGSIK